MHPIRILLASGFLSRVTNNVIFTLNATQFDQLKVLDTDQINLYGYKRFPLMKAFRRLLDWDLPTGLNLKAVKASRGATSKAQGPAGAEGRMAAFCVHKLLDASRGPRSGSSRLALIEEVMPPGTILRLMAEQYQARPCGSASRVLLTRHRMKAGCTPGAGTRW